jgi:hypothetical protein
MSGRAKCQGKSRRERERGATRREASLPKEHETKRAITTAAVVIGIGGRGEKKRWEGLEKESKGERG